MYCPRNLRKFVAMAIFMATVSVVSASAQDSLTLSFWFGTASGYPNQQDAVIPVFVENPTDSIAGFLFHFNLNRPDMIYFSGTTDDIIDTSGTLISGWRLVSVTSPGGTGHDLKVVALSNMPPNPIIPAIAPQSGNIPLIKLKADVYNVPDTASDRLAQLQIVEENFSNFQFSDEDGQMIGLIQDTIYDTAWFQCTAWADPPNNTICINWIRVPSPPADSFYVDTTLTPVLDTAKVIVFDGLFVIHQCGDANGNGTINILDGTYLINYLYRQGPPPPALLAGDANGNGALNILDVTFLIEYLYKGGSIPVYYR